MNTFRLRLIFFTVLGLVSHTALQAQPGTSAPTSPTQTIHFRFMAWERAITDLYLNDGRNNYIPITAPGYAWSPGYEVISGGSTLTLYRQVEKGGLKTYQAAAQATLTPDCRDYQIALLRQNTDFPYRMIPLPRDLNVFGPGQVRLFNFTPHPVAVKLGEENLELPPLEWRMVTVSPDNKYRVVMLNAIHIAGAWVRGGNRVISLRPDHRADVTIIHSDTKDEQAANAAAEHTDRTQTLLETEYISPRMRRLSVAN